MAQQILNSSEAPDNFNTLKTDDILKDEMKTGLLFADEESALKSILKWGELTLCPIMKARRDKTLAESGGKSRGRRCLDCPHGRSRKGKTKGERPNQSVKFTKCPFSIVIMENDDGTWEITKAVLEHYGHILNKQEYYSHAHTKRLTEADQCYLKELIDTKANPANIASCLNQKSGKNFTGQDVRNLIKKSK